MRIEGTSALVAGGASGLGEATARALAAAGATVTIADVNAEKGEVLAGELGAVASFVETDVTDAAAVGDAVGRRQRPTAACGSRSAARASAGRSASPTRAGPTTWRCSPR
jgi:NAD(P)-dependent dehydrogenase (short-subunit alcohol dehydrogenase family)